MPTATRRPRRSATERIGEFGARDEEQRPRVHRRRHADVDRPRERRLAVLGAADPVRGHEAELDRARSRRLAFSMLAEFDVSTSTGASAGRRSRIALSARPWLWKVPSCSEVPIRIVIVATHSARSLAC